MSVRSTRRRGVACAATGAVALLMLAAVLAPSLVGGAPRERMRQERLPNGFRVIVRENPVAPVVAVSLLVAAGTRWERPDTAGISNFVDAVMVKGTTKRSGADIAETVAALGGKMSAAGDVDYSEVRGTALARFWHQLLDLTAELVLEPKLAASDVDEERGYVLSRIQRRHDNPNARAFDELYAALYGAHPYALPTLGTPQSLARMDRAAVVAHYRAFYTPERMVLAVSGQVVASEVLAEARRLFGGMPRGAATPDAPIAPPLASDRRVVIRQPAQQAQILLGAVAPAMDDPDHAAVKVLSTVLGGGMAGRLFVELRDKRGLAYTAASYYDAMREPAPLILYVGTAPENEARTEEALSAEVARIKTERVGDDELARAKGYVLGRYALDRRTNERQAWYLAFYELTGVGEGYTERYRRAVEAVTAADVQRVAARYLARPTTVVLQPGH